MSDKSNPTAQTTDNSSTRKNRRKRNNRKNNQRRRVRNDEQPFWKMRGLEQTEEAVDTTKDDENFGNRLDYQPDYGNGIGGFYREPMDGESHSWSQRRQKNNRGKHLNEEQPDGVLTMRMPSWNSQSGNNNEQFTQGENSVLTIRQHDDLSRSLRYNKGYESTQLSRHEQGNDPATGWQRFMNDLKTGRSNTRKKRRDSRRRGGQNKQQQKNG